MADAWDDAARARRDYAELVAPLSDADAARSTLCGDWNAHHVTGHLVSFVDVGLPAFFLNMARHRFDYDRAADTLARRTAERPMADLLETLRAKARKKSTIPIFPAQMTTTDVVIHTQDVRRGLGLEGTPSPDLVETGLVFLTTDRRAAAIVGKGVYDGLRFEATDSDWSFGSGDLVRGPAESVLMAMAGRDVYDELDGGGVETLRQRTS